MDSVKLACTRCGAINFSNRGALASHQASTRCRAVDNSLKRKLLHEAHVPEVSLTVATKGFVSEQVDNISNHPSCSQGDHVRPSISDQWQSLPTAYVVFEVANILHAIHVVPNFSKVGHFFLNKYKF
jgi:hypothetical protein